MHVAATVIDRTVRSGTTALMYCMAIRLLSTLVRSELDIVVGVERKLAVNVGRRIRSERTNEIVLGTKPPIYVSHSLGHYEPSMQTCLS